MKLYRIRRKDTGEFFTTWSPYSTEPYFNTSGAFFKKIDTIADHLRLLVSDWHRHDNSLGFGALLKRGNYTVKKTYKARLNRYEVVVSNVSVNGEEIIKASDILKGNK